MKNRNVLFISAFLLLLSGCGNENKQAKTETTVTTETTKDSVATANANSKDNAVAAGNEQGLPEGCARGVAEPIVKKSVFPEATFKLNLDKISGVETISLKKGDKLTIKNEGCEYYVLTFRFETSRFKTEPDDAYGWAENAVTLMKEIEPGINPPIEVAKGTKTLEEMLKQTVRFNFGEEIDFGGEDIRSYLTLDKAEKLSENIYRVEISYMMGPL